MGLRERKKYQKLYDSIIQIQSFLRGRRCRICYLNAKQYIKKVIAAVTIRKKYRCFRAQCKVHTLKYRNRRAVAVVYIQKIVRGNIGREKVKYIRASIGHTDSAIKIQASIRSFLSRRKVAIMLTNRA